jgi:hypothetical protein
LPIPPAYPYGGQGGLAGGPGLRAYAPRCRRNATLPLFIWKGGGRYRFTTVRRALAAAEMMPSQIPILSSLLVGLAATVGTIVIHGFALHTIVMGLRRNLQHHVLGVRIWVNMTFIVGATLIVLAGHLVEIALWAFALDVCGAVADSYTTSGSDIVLPPQWKLLGPFEAVNGMLMFGISTAAIFAVIQRLIRTTLGEF